MLGMWCGKRPRQNLDIWKERTLSDVTEESNLRIFCKSTPEQKKKLKGSLEKRIRCKNMLNEFLQLITTLLNVKGQVIDS